VQSYQNSEPHKRTKRGKGTNHVPKPPPIVRSISNKKKDGKPKKQ